MLFFALLLGFVALVILFVLKQRKAKYPVIRYGSSDPLYQDPDLEVPHG